MQIFLRAITIMLAGAVAAGCATAPTTAGSVHHFNAPATESPEDAQKRRDCMADNSSFNQRQLVVSAAAIQNAWVYCFRQSDIWYPGKEDDKPELNSGW